MASPAPAALAQENLVTLKVNLDGSNHKFKLPLRFLGAWCLEEKLRTQLLIAGDAKIKIERFSDSAASYVTLDSTNAAVFKQLYRAAKAKQKLKLRITTDRPLAAPNAVAEAIPESPVPPVADAAAEKVAEKSGPRPASVEDELEPEVVEHVDEASTAPLVDVSTPITAKHTDKPNKDVPTSSAPQLSAVETLVKEKMDFSKRIHANLKQINDHINDRASERNLNLSGLPGFVPARQLSLPYRPSYAVCCNNCNSNIANFHYHCSTCDEGDYDLCLECVNAGATCSGTNHWMIKRVVKNGVIINSTTERLAPKLKAKLEKLKPKAEPARPTATVQTGSAPSADVINNFLFNSNIRTCNSCVQDMSEEEFLHCETCEDFDLCKACFAKNQHGHHPKHAFAPAVAGTRLGPEVTRLLAAGRAQTHHAICDGCDENIVGVRHKCLDCPDWDYCANCVVNAAFVHAGHRFVPVYESIEPPHSICARSVGQPVHHGICCDGPLCGRNGLAEYITGVRFKCAVCNDTDFCANCEANPANEHNRTHPLIKFKTPVRHVSVTTTGAHGDGQQMPAMGDRIVCPALRSRLNASRISVASSQATTAAPAVQTVAEAEPTELASPAPVKAESQEANEVKEVKEAKEVEPEVKPETQPETQPEPTPKEACNPKPFTADDLVAVYKSDTIADGTEFDANQLFEQTWILRNEGHVPWPAGCSVKCVGGDYMGHVDSNHPAATSDIASAFESTVAHMPLFPGQEAQFSVLLRTPNRNGRAVSNWRLTTRDGFRFGDRLWCDIVVKKTADEEAKENKEAAEEPKDVEEEPTPAAEPKPEMSESQMIFPKLEKESPVSSIHDLRPAVPGDAPNETEKEVEYEDCAEGDDWVGSDEGFATDEEYDILDASDEEVLEGKKRRSSLKK